jgi:hypothetical protein
MKLINYISKNEKPNDMCHGFFAIIFKLKQVVRLKSNRFYTIKPLRADFNIILSVSLLIFLFFSMPGCVSLKGSLGGYPTLDGNIDKLPVKKEMSIADRAEAELELIKNLMINNQSVLGTLTFDKYLKDEKEQNDLISDLDKLYYRQDFRKWLQKKYNIK